MEKKDVLEVVTNDEGCSETMRYRLHIMSKGLEVSWSSASSSSENKMSIKQDSDNGLSLSLGSSEVMTFGPVNSSSYLSVSPFSVTDA